MGYNDDIAINEIKQLNITCMARGCNGKQKQRRMFVGLGALIQGYNYKDDSEIVTHPKTGERGVFIYEWFCEKCGGRWSLAGGVVVP